MTKRIKVITDGACRYADLKKHGQWGPGGWGVVIYNIDGIETETLMDGEKWTTSNQMELMAAIKALEYLEEGVTAEIYTDSKLLVDGITDWINYWRENNWQRPNGRELRNKDLWEKLDQLNEKRNIKWIKATDKEIKPAHNAANEGIKPFLPKKLTRSAK